MRVRGPWRSRGGVGGPTRPAVALRAPLHEVGAPGARAPRWPGRGGRVCKGIGAPDAGPTAGRGTSSKLQAWPEGRGRGRARG